MRTSYTEADYGIKEQLYVMNEKTSQDGCRETEDIMWKQIRKIRH